MDHFDFPREAVSTAMFYIDRMVLLSEEPITKAEFQLLAVSAVYLATKLTHQAASTSVLTIRHVKQIAKNLFTTDRIAGMEMDILEGLHWYVHPPTAAQFLDLFLELYSADDDSGTGGCFAAGSGMSSSRRRQIHENATFWTEHAVLDVYFVRNRHCPSEIAMAALYNAVVASCLPTMASYRPYHNSQYAQSSSFWSGMRCPLQAVQAKLAAFRKEGAPSRSLQLDPHRVELCRHRLYDLMEYHQQQVTASTATSCALVAMERMGSPVSIVDPVSKGGSTKKNPNGDGKREYGEAQSSSAASAKTTEPPDDLATGIVVDPDTTDPQQQPTAAATTASNKAPPGGTRQP